jgi:hypothetical protein
LRYQTTSINEHRHNLKHRCKEMQEEFREELDGKINDCNWKARPDHIKVMNDLKLLG